MSVSYNGHEALGASKYYIDCERMRHPNTGIYEFCHRLANSISDILEEGEQLVSYSPELPFGTFRPSIGLMRCRRFHKFLHPDPVNAGVWHCTYQRSRYIPRSGTPLILTIHDLNFLHEGKSKASVERCMAEVQKNVDRAAAVVAISKFVASDMRSCIRMDEGALRVIYNGCEPLDEHEMDKPDYAPAGNFCFALGPTIAKKNFRVLPGILVNNNYELVIAGFTEDPYMTSILRYAADLGVAERVHIVGPVSDAKKTWYYAHCSAFVFPSLAEGFGLPVVEAMQFGKPVFLSRATSLPEVGGDQATYFDSFDPDGMSRIFNETMSAPFTAQRAADIKARARSFSWRNAAKAYLELYRECAGRKAAR
jgi:glycosyltransferase involved in cell wall biosynthesis